MSRSLFLVRHGSTDWSDAGRLNGWTDVPLNARGRAQAVAISGLVAGSSFAGVWTSDLRRAARTAELAVGPARSDQRLRELDFGAIEGRTWDECSPAVQRGLMEFDSFAAPGGESVQRFIERVGRFLDQLPSGEHLLFTHGGVIRALGRSLGREPQVGPGGILRLQLPD